MRHLLKKTGWLKRIKHYFIAFYLKNKYLTTEPDKFLSYPLKGWGWGSGQFDTPMVFPRISFLKTGWNPAFLWLLISHHFPENCIEIGQVVQKIWQFSPLILTIFTDFWFVFFWHFLVTKKLMTSACNRWCQYFYTFSLL